MKSVLGHLTTLVGAAAFVALTASALADSDTPSQRPAGTPSQTASKNPPPADNAQGSGNALSGLKGSDGKSSKSSTYGQSGPPPVSKGGPSGPEENRSVGPEKKIPEGRDNAGGKPTSVSRLVARKKTPGEVSNVVAGRGSPNMPGGIGTGAKRVGTKDQAPGDDK